MMNDAIQSRCSPKDDLLAAARMKERQELTSSPRSLMIREFRRRRCQAYPRQLSSCLKSKDSPSSLLMHVSS